MNKSITLALLVSGLVVCSLSAQHRLHIGHSCGFIDELDPTDIYGFASDSEAQDALSNIMQFTGLPANFTIQAANVPNAAAVVHEGNRYILYNQFFMKRIKNETQTDWAAMSILAHEIGHHLSGHTLDQLGSRPDKELEADQFSGFVLYKMGATLEEARVAIDRLANDVGTRMHPPKSARLAAITNGWLKAEELDKGPQDRTVARSIPAPVMDQGVVLPPAEEPAGPAIGRFERVWSQEGVVEQGQEGIRIHTHFSLTNLKGKPCRAVATVFDRRTGQPLEDVNRQYRSNMGWVATVADFQAAYPQSDFPDFQLFLPYEELHLGEGIHELEARVQLEYKERGVYIPVGLESDPIPFTYRLGPPMPTGGLEDMWVDFDVFEDGQKGMRIHLKIQVQNLEDRECRSVVWFYREGGGALEDQNGEFNTVDGKVSVGKDFIPDFSHSMYSDFSLFLPYSELHLEPGTHYLKFDAALFFRSEDGYKQIGKPSDFYRFTFTR
jgi:hypothetical protein